MKIRKKHRNKSETIRLIKKFTNNLTYALTVKLIWVGNFSHHTDKQNRIETKRWKISDGKIHSKSYGKNIRKINKVKSNIIRQKIQKYLHVY